jgi:ATP-binding protein involved in chromosome partitioning
MGGVMIAETTLSYLQTVIDPSIQAAHYTLTEASPHTYQLVLRYHTGVEDAVIAEGLATQLQRHTPAQQVTVHCRQAVVAHQISNHVQGKATIKNIIAIVSGKGGVGKSTVTTNLAIALQQLGAAVGVIDADIHGPSQPTMLGVTAADLAARSSGLDPVSAHQIVSASIRYFMTKEDPVMWRGPMVSRALEQMVHDITWPSLDYLLIDMPPGTGDIALTLAKKLPVTAAVVVTTPQQVACIDAEKAAKMCANMQVPMLGVIENMATYHCPHCQASSAVFGAGGGARLAHTLNLSVLATLPLLPAVQAGGDQGVPGVLSDQGAFEGYRSLAVKIGQQLALRPLDSMRS